MGEGAASLLGDSHVARLHTYSCAQGTGRAGPRLWHLQAPGLWLAQLQTQGLAPSPSAHISRGPSILLPTPTLLGNIPGTHKFVSKNPIIYKKATCICVFGSQPSGAAAPSAEGWDKQRGSSSERPPTPQKQGDSEKQAGASAPCTGPYHSGHWLLASQLPKATAEHMASVGSAGGYQGLRTDLPKVELEI